MIGTGRDVAVIEAGGTHLVITNSFSGGFVLPFDFGHIAVKLRFFLMVAGGVGLQVALAAILIACGVRPFSFVVSEQLQPASMFLFSNLLIVVFNVIPNLGARASLRPNDGRTLFTLPFLHGKDLKEFLASSITNDGIWYLNNGRYEEAERIFRRAIFLYPDLLLGQCGLAHALLDQLKTDEAIQVLERYSNYAFGTQDEAPWLADLSWAYITDHKEVSLRKADAMSKRAFEKYPEGAAARAVRACALIAIGKPQEGIALLGELADPKESKKVKYGPIVYLFAAYAYHSNCQSTNAWRLISYLNAHAAAWSPSQKQLYDMYMNRITTSQRSEVGRSIAAM